MRKFSIFILLGAILTSVFSASRAQTDSTKRSGSSSSGESQLIDIKANLVFPHKINDTLSVLCLVGDFAAQHNGAVITADSAVRYEDDRLECFGNVLINKNTTYAYADTAEYDGANNTASLFSPLIKVVDEDVTMYTYNFTFNTLDNIGHYWGGGVSTKAGEVDEETGEVGEESVMESDRGYYYADEKQVVGVERVELKGEDYLLKGDSVIYDMALDRAYFYENTNIWSVENDDYIYGDRGLYDKAESFYNISRNGYILTKEQEVWCDTLDYYRDEEIAILKSNIQIDDTTNKSLAFGDYAKYWGKLEQVLLTRRATLVNYDPEQSDSLFLSGDSILLLSYPLNEGPAAEMMAKKDEAESALLAELLGISEPEPQSEPQPDADHIHHDHDHDHDHEASEQQDINIGETTDSLSMIEDAVEVEEVETVADTRHKLDTIPSERELKRRAKRAAVKARNDARISALEAREYRKLQERSDKLRAKIAKKEERGRSIYADSMVLLRVINQMRDMDRSDSLELVDSLTKLPGIDSLLLVGGDSLERDSLYRVAKVYRNARSYRRDMQMSCDSLVAISFDTTMQLHIKPLLWSGTNQVKSNEMYFYTKDGDMDYADFVGSPIMVAQVLESDTTHFNQVSGKEMKAYFTNNEVTRNEVNGNVETIYYMQDEETGEPTTMSKVESGSATFFIENRELDGVIYRTAPTYTFAPLDKVPADLSLYLADFGWYGSERPTRKTIFDRTIRPTMRVQKQKLRRPLFLIRSEITESRKRLVQRGDWSERSEPVSADATKWMKSLGYTPGEPRKEGEGVL
ncbi:MAG: OstA-like protein [Rikenellaceae bacterium]